MGKYKNFTFTKQTVQIHGKPVEILVTDGAYANEHGMSVDGKCFLCGFKPRKGDHSYWIHLAIGFGNKALELMPFFDDDGNDLSDGGTYSQGWFEIGSECRKRLPEKFVQKRKKEEQ